MSTVAENQIQWLKTVKAVALACIERHNIISCPYVGTLDETDRNRVAELGRSIHGHARDLIEQESDTLGCTALLGRDPSITETITISLLTCARLDRDVARNEVSTVSDVISLVAARRPQQAIEVRNLFRSDGSLHGYVSLSYSSTLDETRVRLTETSLNTFLNIPNDETATICGIVGKIRSVRI